MDLKEILLQLDAENPDHWTADGAPQIMVVRDMTGEKTTRADIQAVWPDFTKAARAAHVEESPEAAATEAVEPAAPVAEPAVTEPEPAAAEAEPAADPASDPAATAEAEAQAKAAEEQQAAEAAALAQKQADEAAAKAEQDAKDQAAAEAKAAADAQAKAAEDAAAAKAAEEAKAAQAAKEAAEAEPEETVDPKKFMYIEPGEYLDDILVAVDAVIQPGKTFPELATMSDEELKSWHEGIERCLIETSMIISGTKERNDNLIQRLNEAATLIDQREPATSERDTIAGYLRAQNRQAEKRYERSKTLGQLGVTPKDIRGAKSPLDAALGNRKKQLPSRWTPPTQRDR